MDNQQQDPKPPRELLADEPSLPFISYRCRPALDQLRSAFAEAQPLAILNGGWASGASQLIRSFLTGIESDVVVAQITEPGPDAVLGMRQLLQSIGREPKDMNLTDLEDMFTEFLCVQKIRHQRTIVMIEESQDNGEWALGMVHRLAASEIAEKSGLMVILSRRSRLSEPPIATSLGTICDQIGQHISLSPFTLAETTEYVRWRIEAAPGVDISGVLDFHAITLIHELCSGVPDAVNTLVCKSIRLAFAEDKAPVTTDLVMKASKMLRLPPMMQHQRGEAGSALVEPKRVVVDSDSDPISVILTHNGNTVIETTMDQPVLTIGRSEENDLRINSKYVSRQHAILVRHGAEVFVTDLGSTNGTYVNSQRIQDPVLIQRDTIWVGGYRIKFNNPNARSSTAPQGTGLNDTVIINGLKKMRDVLGRKDRQELPLPLALRQSARDSDGSLS